MEGYCIMARSKGKEPTQPQKQVYDNVLKSLFDGHERQVLPYFLPDAEYLETLDIEVHRTTLRVDRAYKVMYEEQLHTVNFEFQTGSDQDLEARLLEYHAYLHRKYHLPVISIIVYPFRTTMATPPFVEKSGTKEILVFHFDVFPLWKLQAEQYISEHAVLLYSLLPTMEGADTSLLNKAIDEMIEYYKDDQTQLAQQLRWMGIVLRRADTVPLVDKESIEERLTMYDELFEKDPKMRKIRAESEAKGESRGRTQGLQSALVIVVEKRFPPLADLVQQKVKQLDKPDQLILLLNGMASAPDEEAARLLFDLLVA
jgi:hypothetical protein